MINLDLTIEETLECYKSLAQQMHFLPNKKPELHRCLVPNPDVCGVCQILLKKIRHESHRDFTHQFGEVARKQYFIMRLYQLYAMKAFDIVAHFIDINEQKFVFGRNSNNIKLDFL